MNNMENSIWIALDEETRTPLMVANTFDNLKESLDVYFAIQRDTFNQSFVGTHVSYTPFSDKYPTNWEAPMPKYKGFHTYRFVSDDISYVENILVYNAQYN